MRNEVSSRKGNAALWKSLICLLLSVAFLGIIISCGESSDNTDPVSITEANQYGSEFATAQENAFDAVTVDNGSVPNYYKVKNTEGTVFMEGTNVVPKTRLWTFVNFTDTETGLTVNGTIDETWPDSDSYTGKCNLSLVKADSYSVEITGSKAKTGSAYSGTISFNETEFSAGLITDIMTGSH